MADVKERSAAEAGTFALDGAYFREQTKEAVRTFVAPLSGVIRAVKGDDPQVEISSFSGSKKRFGAPGRRTTGHSYYKKKRA